MILCGQGNYNSFYRTMEKFCLKWNDFESNVREYFKKLRKGQEIFDVTLATEDGQEMKAHKVVLSAGSDFFSDIFSRNNHPGMYIFLKGVNSSQLEQVTDFLYYGEASITQDEMKLFFETAKSLQVKGLLGDIEGIGQNIQEEQNPEYEDTNNKYEKDYHATLDDTDNQENIVDSFISRDASVNDTFNGEKPAINVYKDLDHQVGEMIEKTIDGKWKCKVCGKLAIRKIQTQSHAETHIEGLSFSCDLCNKTCSTRQYLRQHITFNHSGSVFFCNVCDKTGMNRRAYHNHNNRYHKK